MKLFLPLTMLAFWAPAFAQQYKPLEPYKKFTSTSTFHKLVVAKDGTSSKPAALYKTVDPAISLNGLYVDVFNKFSTLWDSKSGVLLDSKVLWDSGVVPTIMRFPGEPVACPAQYGGAIFTGTYYKTGDGMNITFPTTIPSGLMPATCVNQPNGVRTCYSSVSEPGHQVCDYGASPYNQFVTNNECDLLNQIPGVSFYAATDPYRHMQISAYCQKFVDGSLAAGSLPVLLSLPKRASLKMDNIVKIENGYEFSCALRNAGSVGELYCWGKNLNGELGLGTVGFASTHAHKVYFPGVTAPNVTDFSVAQSNVCAILAPDSANPTGSLYCWGKNDVGQIGLPVSPAAGAVAASGVPQKITLNYAGSTDYGSTAVGGTGYMYVAYGYTSLASTGEIIKQISIGNAFLSSTISGFTGCFVTDKKKSYCWGFNNYGQYGTGRPHSYTEVKGVRIRQAFQNISAPSTTGVVHPSRSATDSFWAADSIHVAGHAICILGGTLGSDTSLNGKVLCSGSQQGTAGILGSRYINTTLHSISSPVMVNTSATGGDLSNVKQIAANEKAICARVDNSTGYSDPNQWKMYCWGKVPKVSGTTNLVTNQYALPMQMEMVVGGILTRVDVNGVKSVSVGEYSACFIREDTSYGGTNHRSYCAGINRSQMLGPDSNFVGATTVASGSSIVLGEFDYLHKFYSGSFDNCGLASTGTCSNGETIGVSAIATGKGQPSVAHHCHVKGGNVFCSGENYFGQLGKADLFIPSTAIPIMKFPLPNVPVQY